MSIHGQIIVGVVSLLVLAYVVSLTVRRELSEQWCLLWIITLGAAIVLVAAPSLLLRMTHLVGAMYPASALTMVALFFLLLLAIHASSEATVHSRRIVTLTQQLALLRQTVESLEKKAGGGDCDAGKAHG